MIARVGSILAPVTTVYTSGEAGWYNDTTVYRPVRDPDGVLRFQSLLGDVLLKDPITPPREGVLIEASSALEPRDTYSGQEYTLRQTSQRVIEWSITPEASLTETSPL